MFTFGKKITTLYIKIKAIIFLFMNYFIILTYRPNKTAGVLLIRLDHIGDFILWLDTARHYKKLYPNQKITLLTSPNVAELALLLPYWHEVIVLNTVFFENNWRYRWQQLVKIRKIGFETAIQPTHSRNFLLGDSLIYVTGASNRIGSQGDCNNISKAAKYITDRWYTKLISNCNNDLMELDRNAEFFSHLSGKTYTANLPVIPPLQKLPANLQIEQAYCVMFPGGSWKGKQWPVEKFAETAQILIAEKNWRIVIAGGPNDRASCIELTKKIGSHTTDLCCLTSLPELVELIRNCVLLISNDTSAIHIAAAVNTPGICILGGGHFGRFLPYPERFSHAPVAVFHNMPCFGCKWQCTQAHDPQQAVPCIAYLEMTTVLAAMKKILC
jgi:ADP-heptose:LPS heptosyltransferase